MASVIDTYTKRVFTHNNKMSGETPPTGVKSNLMKSIHKYNQTIYIYSIYMLTPMCLQWSIVNN